MDDVLEDANAKIKSLQDEMQGNVDLYLRELDAKQGMLDSLVAHLSDAARATVDNAACYEREYGERIAALEAENARLSGKLAETEAMNVDLQRWWDEARDAAAARDALLAEKENEIEGLRLFLGGLDMYWRLESDAGQVNDMLDSIPIFLKKRGREPAREGE
jgi:predicted nuclease with TOPRIM domain